MISECQTCGWQPTNILGHRTQHDGVTRGVRWPETARDCVVERGADHVITLVTPHDRLSLRRRAEVVARVANWEMRLRGEGYDRPIFLRSDKPDSRKQRLLIYHRGVRALGLCVLEDRADPYRLRWSDNTQVDYEGPPVVPTIGFVWTHPSLRRQRIALNLVGRAAQLAKAEPADLAWYPPFTLDSHAFAQSVTGPYVILARTVPR